MIDKMLAKTVTEIVGFRNFALAMILLAGPLLAFSQTPESQTEPITAALRARDYDKAVELSRAALAAAPDNAQLWTLQGIALVSKGDSKEALTAFQRALKISPNNVGALAGAAQIEYQAGSQKAVPLLNQLIELRPDNSTAHAMLAVLDYRRADCAAAVPQFEKAGELIDSQIDALHAYATCLVKVKRLDDAEKTFQKAFALRPDDPRERLLLASIEIMDHKSQDALVTLQPLLDSKDVNSNTLQLASRAYEDTGDTPHAVSALRQALLLDPKNTSLYLDFATICFSHESFQVGIDVITEGLLLQPKAD
ncbi:MAG: tetratricopeptide repeat protein, partial [Candidatus Acidiferrum sp.]